MAKIYVLYNPIAGNGKKEILFERLSAMMDGEIVMIDVTSTDYKAVLCSLERDDLVVVSGGDGTLNCFVNEVKSLSFENDVLYYPSGSGNDFAREFGKNADTAPFSIKRYIDKTPTVSINGKERYFINGVGYGIDGYCCAEGDRLRSITNKPIDYTAIAIKGVLFHYKPTNAKVTVDGNTTEYKKVWIAPTMIGKYYGGGMMPTPAQDRDNEEGKLSVMIFHDTGKIQTLMTFPPIFKGEHVKKKKFVTILTGRDITVEFDEPRTVQIDGETVFNVTKYNAKSYK